MPDLIPFILSCLPVAIFAAVIIMDLRFGVCLNGWWQRNPIYRDEQPARFWTLEGLMIVVALCLAIRPALELWAILNPSR